MQIRPATKQDSRAIAELALLAGEGIPAFFWQQSQQPGEDLIDVGARNALSETENFSYRNVHLAVINSTVAGMMLAYRLPTAEEAEDLTEFPDFIRPLIELEQSVPDSYYINMLAAYPSFRNQGIGTTLMQTVDKLARRAGCSLSSLEVFEQNEGALRLYHKLGYRIIDERPVIEHPSHPYSGNIALMVREVRAALN